MNFLLPTLTILLTLSNTISYVESSRSSYKITGLQSMASAVGVDSISYAAEAPMSSNAFNGYPGDDKCVGVFPDLCKFLDELVVPEEIDVSRGQILTLAAYNINHLFHRDLPLTSMYGYGTSKDTATAPGPTLVARRNIMAKVKWENYLYDDTYSLPDSFAGLVTNGSIPISMHLHGGETEPPSDGHPYAWFTATGEKGSKFVKSVHSYHNGQLPSTLWYHDHTFAMTMHNVYKGLAGFYILKDPEDTEKGFDLPESEFDIPLLIQNKVFEEDGNLHESNGLDEDESITVGNYMIVNGKVWPYYNVEKTMYRFRILNGANLILMNISFVIVNQTLKDPSAVGLDWVVPAGNFIEFQQIASDGGYINEPYTTSLISVGPSERVEILVDFSTIPDSNSPVEIIMINTADITIDEFGIPVDADSGTLMKFIIRPNARRVAVPRVPKVMNSVPEVSTASAVRTRWITLSQVGPDGDVIHVLGMHRFEHATTEALEEGKTEIWALVNLTPQSHTIHLHAVKFQLLSRQLFDENLFYDGNCSFLYPDNSSSCFINSLHKPQPGSEMGWKDTIVIKEYYVTMIVVKATSQTGQRLPFNASAYPGYVWHCHMLEHEDNEMIRPLEFRQPKQDIDFDKIVETGDYPEEDLID